MQFCVNYQCYDSFGGHPSISAVAALLEIDFPNIGTAINEVEFILHFKQDGPARKTLERSFAAFHSALTSLPRCEFRRSKRRLVLEVEGTFTTGYAMHRNLKASREIDPKLVHGALTELINALPIVKAKLKKTDDFDYEGFERFLIQKLNQLPSNAEELKAIREIVAGRRKAVHEQKDEWEKLDVDWEDYSPRAREVVPLPFLWEIADDFAPNGNDSGADTLELFREWNASHRDQSALVFLSKLMTQWEIDPDNPYENDITSKVYREMIVGLAFASAKLRGECEMKLRELSISAIDKYLSEISMVTDWEHKDECVTKLSQSKSVIERMP